MFINSHYPVHLARETDRFHLRYVELSDDFRERIEPVLRMGLCPTRMRGMDRVGTARALLD